LRHISAFDIVYKLSVILLGLQIIKIGVIMKLYKFRSIAGNSNCESVSKSNYCRVKDIIKTGKFWCSYFWELNDPVEGLFFANTKLLKIIYNMKIMYKICSFSGINGFKNPLLWGYYASGFKGIAIEIEINSRYIYQIQYVSEIFPTIIKENNINDKHIQDILTRKLIGWQHEDEFRFLMKTNENKQKIGEITNVYFGDPYGNIDISSELKKEEAIKEYNDNKDKLIGILDENLINYKYVKIHNNEVYVYIKKNSNQRNINTHLNL
jgi:hypothetical protein